MKKILSIVCFGFILCGCESNDANNSIENDSNVIKSDFGFEIKVLKEWKVSKYNSIMNANDLLLEKSDRQKSLAKIVDNQELNDEEKEMHKNFIDNYNLNESQYITLVKKEDDVESVSADDFDNFIKNISTGDQSVVDFVISSSNINFDKIIEKGEGDVEIKVFETNENIKFKYSNRQGFQIINIPLNSNKKLANGEIASQLGVIVNDKFMSKEKLIEWIKTIKLDR